ncbi:hypothetical protein A2Z33_06685 [Candidatus Gottesmanbacteria bacterium RBG_16_52_11]|uniref:Undecaprenyl-diphosphatase n=1 Tax=Candidatus Gottesmanbacteria bacterium RBG_16_52_11 TaxID=1798374 RepID=A0A1F5YYH4_9BACT|nr:MAG: hypothetical protein A2Z33_06685 [Candidatus Gottesmanbacteria bacterium RBG_16_52_11]
MELFPAFILAAVEGLTEFLPVSSTGHLILASNLLGVRQTPFVTSFEIVIQLGAILAVAVLYLRQLSAVRIIWPKLAVAFLPTAVTGFALYGIIKSEFFTHPDITVAALLIGGFILLFSDRIRLLPAAEINSLSVPRLLLIGSFQSLSVIPGVSRAGAAILGGLVSGLPRRQAVEFSFLLAVPTILAATVYDLVRSAGAFSPEELGLMFAGSLVAFITAALAVKSFVTYVSGRSLAVFGWYRIAAAILFFLFA